jgi:serine/threonine protein phosphatase PrpC
MDCPYCETSLPDDDVFCEACGKPLHPAVPVAEPVKGCTCGAPAEEIDEDGYCGRCGRLARRPPTDHMEMELSSDFAGVSDRGLKHQRNEDRFAMQRVDTAGFVMVVCDGVSSSTQSETASSLAAESVAEALGASLRRHSSSSPERTVRRSILDAQERLHAAYEGHAADPPSTTVVAALVNGIEVTIGWAGDSRAYWISGGEARQLTVDHSWVNDMVSSGEMSAEQAATAPQAHGITHWLGADAAEHAEPDVMHFQIPGPGHLLLCTDGLWNYAQTPEEISALLAADDGADDGEDMGYGVIHTARRMIEFANEHGGHDNITAILLRLEPNYGG